VTSAQLICSQTPITTSFDPFFLSQAASSALSAVWLYPFRNAARLIFLRLILHQLVLVSALALPCAVSSTQ
jgi:hypothetical protein